nr:hypothetical protein [Tanacetum cinerariifolium]
MLTNIVKDNKQTRASTLKTELRSIQLGTLSMEAYFQKIESLVTTLTSLDCIVNDEDVVHYAITRLPFPLLSERDAPAEEVCTADEVKSNNNLVSQEMEQPNPTFAKIPILNTGKSKQWKFRIQQYLQNEHYALWEVIEFGDSYEAPQEVADTVSASEGSTKKKGRAVAVTTEDMQKRRNDVKARTTLLLALPDEHQLRFSKYNTAQELWAAILKTFGGNEATKKTKKNQLKQQYGNFKAEGKETLEQTFNRLQAIISHLEFIDIEIEQDDLNQKFLTSLAPEWLMYTIMWRNRSDLDTMSLDDLYNHLKVYEPEVQKKSDTQVSPASADVATASFSHDTVCAYMASKFNGSQVKYEDINQIDEDDIEEMDIKWNMAILSMRADRFWKKTGKKITIQGSKTEEQTPKALMAIDEVGWDWSYMANEEENHALVADQEAPTEFALMAKSSYENEVFDNALCSKACLSQVKARLVEFKNQEIKFYEKIRGLEFKVESKDNRIERLTKELKELKKEKKGLDSKLTGLPEFADDTITDYSRPSPSIESNSSDLQNSDSSVSEKGDSSKSIMSKPMIKFVKATDSPTEVKISKVETVRKPSVKYTEMYRNTTKSPKFDHLAYDCDVWEEQGKAWPKNNNTHKSNSQNVIDDKGYWDNGCSRHIIGNISYLSDYEPYDGGYVSFGQRECIVLGKDFKLKDDTNVLLRTPRQHNMYSIDLNNIVPHKDLTCLVAKASTDECMLWHMRLGHLNFKTMNKLVRHNMVRGLPSKCFENDHTCVACPKGKHHKASCKTKFTWTFFLKTKDETSGIFKNFITEIENLKELKVLVNKSQNKTSYELFNGRTPAIRFLKLFGCHVMILNTLDNLEKFNAKGDEGYFIRYSMSNKAFRIFNKRTKRVEENLHVDFLENKLIEKGAGPNWLFDIDTLTNSMNYVPVVVAGTTSTNFSETLAVETAIPTVSSPIPAACLDDSPKPLSDTRLISKRVTSQEDTPSLDNILNLSNRFEDILRVTTNTDDTNGVDANLGNMEYNISASPTPTFRIHKDHPKSQIIGPVDTLLQTRTKSKDMEEQSFIAIIHQKTDPTLLQFYLFSCFLSQKEPKKISNALQDPRVRPIGTKWVLKNKKDEKGIVIRNKARLVAQGYTQEEGIDYEEVFAPVARIKAIRLFLAYASFMGFTVYQMDVKSAFLYGTIDEEVYVMQPPRFQDPEFPARVYKVEKAMNRLHQAPRAWHRGDFILVQVYVDDIIFGSSNPLLCREFEALMHDKFQMSAMSELNFFLVLQVQQKKDGIFLSQDKHQVTPKECHMHAVKRIFRYLKGHPKLGIWIETTDKGTKILATIDGKPRTISKSSIRRNLKLNDEAGISSLPDAELFKNLALMGPSFSGRTVPLFDTMLVHQGEGSRTPTEPHYTPSLEAQQSSPTAPSSPSLPPATTETIPTPASPFRDDSQGKACPTVTGLEAGQDMANIIKTSTLPYDSPLRVTSLAADEGSMQHKLHELTDLCTHLQRQQTEMTSKIAAQDLEITILKARIKLLEDKDGGGSEPSGEDTTIKGKSLETGEEAASILTSGVQVVSVPPAAEVATVSVPTGSGLVPTASPIFPTASVVTPYSRRKGKEKMVESKTPKKKKIQEQMDVQMARELEEEMARDAQRMNEQIIRDAEIARIHTEEELQKLIDGLDRSNEQIAKHLHDYEQAAAELTIGEKIELINELVKYQDHHAKILKYQAQQSKPLSKKQQKEFYMSVLRSHAGWKTKHFKGMSLKEIREKFLLVWKQIEDFVPMASKEEGERIKRKGLSLEQGSAKKIKTAEDVFEEELKQMIQLVPVEEIYVEALQHFDREDLNQLWTLVKETLSIRQAISDKEKELWVELKRLYEPDVEDYDEFPLPDYFSTACEDRFLLLSKRDAPTEEVCTADEVKDTPPISPLPVAYSTQHNSSPACYLPQPISNYSAAPGFGYLTSSAPLLQLAQYILQAQTNTPPPGPAQQSTTSPMGYGSINTCHATLLPQAFTVETLHDLNIRAWNMDTGRDVLRCLISNNVISCNKEKPLVLCHACQLGKHVRLSFDSSSTIVTLCFDIIHSDVWTLPIPSLSGSKYYVLFLDHYSHFVWVYPLIHKSDVLSKFMLFHNYVRTQFKCEIRSFQCDHGGEFDNRTLHKHFADNDIQFRFSCPKTSQQNGKSERMHVTFDEMVFPYGSTQSASVPSYTFLDEPNINLPSVSISTIQPPVHEPTTPPTSQTHVAHSLSPMDQTPITPHSTQSDDHAAPPSPNLAQHVPTFIPDPLLLVNPNPDSVHHKVTRFRVGTNRPVERLTLHLSLVSPLPRSYREAFNDVNWQSATRYKARLVANGSTQLEGIDVDETFSAVVKPWTIRTKKYAAEILMRAGIVNCNPSRTPVDTESKQGTSGAVVCLHMHDPREPYFSALKRILRYVFGTLDYDLQLFSSSTTDLVAYLDADWAGCPTTRRSTSGYCVFLGHNLLSWSAKRQLTLSCSNAEAEYRGVANAVAETCWLHNLLRELHTPLSSATLFYCDNVSAVYLSSNPVKH